MGSFDENRRLGGGLTALPRGYSNRSLFRSTYGEQRLGKARNFCGLGYIHSDHASSWRYSTIEGLRTVQSVSMVSP